MAAALNYNGMQLQPVYDDGGALYGFSNGEYGQYRGGEAWDYFLNMYQQQQAMASPTGGWETNATGDVRRIKANWVEGEPNYYGGAGAQHEYAFQKLQPDGTWTWQNPGEHNEAATYYWAGVNNPAYVEAYNDYKAGRADNLDLARIGYPEALGQAAVRDEKSLTGGSNENDFRQELAFYTANPQIQGLLSQYYTPEMRAAVQQQLSDSSASAQASRDTDSGLGGLAQLAMLAAAIYSGGAALGAWGGAAGASTASGMLAAESAAMMNAGFTAAEVASSLAGLGNAAQIGSILTAAGVPAATAGSLATEALSGMMSGGATAAGAGGTGMDFFDTLDTLLQGGYSNADAWTMAEQIAGDSPITSMVDSFVAGETTAPSWLQSTIDSVKNALGSNATPSNISSAVKSILGGNTGLLGAAAQIGGGLLQGSASTDAASKLAQAQLDAARIAADAAKFRPVGVTTRFGQSQFGYDPLTGQLTSAGYNLTPDVKAQQDQLMAASGGMLNQFTGAQAATAPMGTAAQRAMQLGQGYLATDPQAQAQKYMAEQQALLATGRERDFSTLQNKLAQQGRLGLATGGTSTGMMAANPEMEAFYNAQRQQDLGLAAQATQGGMDYAKFGAGMVGTGGDLLNSMYGTQSAAYKPYQTALGGASMLEGLGQNPMDMGINIGAKGTASAASSGGLLAAGMQNAAQTMAPANANSPWANLLGGVGNYLTQPATTGQAPQGTSWYDPAKFRLTPIT